MRNMPKSQTESKKRRGRPPGAKSKPTTKPKSQSYVERTLEGLTARLEGGQSLSDVEVPLLLMLLHAHNSKDLIDYNEIFETMKLRISKMEAHLRTQQSIKDAVAGSRRIPSPNAGPPNFSPFDERIQQ